MLDRWYFGMIGYGNQALLADQQKRSDAVFGYLRRGGK
jgi:hypothetical protein